MISDIFVANDGNSRDNNPYDNGDWCTSSERNNYETLCYDPSCVPSCVQENSSWHGLHVSGTVIAQTNNSKGLSGIDWNAKILPVRVLGKGGGYSSDVADGIKWASGISVSGVPNNTNPARIINMSLGGSGNCPSSIQSAINQAVSQNIAVVVAAGNNAVNLNTNPYWPANCYGVITVAAITREGHRAYYSNYGSSVFISAPGGENTDPIYSTFNMGATNPTTDTYLGYIGTSMATPHASGIISLMLGLKPMMTLNEIKYNLQKTARSFPNGSTCNTFICGFGIIDAYLAIDNLIVNVSSTSPNEAINNQDVSISVYGKGFLSGVGVKLKRNGYSDINCQNINVVNINKIDCTMPLVDVSSGNWNLFVYNTDGSSHTLLNYFRVTEQSINSIIPVSGYNNQSVMVNFYGSGFIWPFTAKLSKSGHPDISCLNYGFVNSSNVYCTFNLSGSFPGKRDIIFTNGNGRVITVTDGFDLINIQPYINSISPSFGYNDRMIDIKIYGGGFLSTSTAKISKTGFEDISCSLSVLSSTYSVCQANLSGEWDGARDFILYSGTNTITMINSFNILSQSLSVSSINPVAGYNNNSNCEILIYGTGFKPISQPKLSKTGYSDIFPYSFDVRTSTFIISYFNLNGAVYGKRNIYINNGIDYYFKLDAFNIIDFLGSPYISSVYPKSAFNNSDPVIDIYGDNFINGLLIKLRREGFDDINVNAFDIISSTYISGVILPLKGKTAGVWSLRIINPNSYYYDYAGFAVLEVKENTRVYNPVVDPNNTEGVIISYNNSTQSQVSIKVYDNMGKLIKTLYSGNSSSGLNKIKWDAKDSSGNRVKSGMYVIRIETSNYTEHRRIVVIK